MVARRHCAFVMPDGRSCRAGPQRERPYCFAHDPERAEGAAEARRLGGLRRRKEGTLAIAYDLPGLDSVEGIRRLLEIVVTDGLGWRTLPLAAVSRTRHLRLQAGWAGGRGIGRAPTVVPGTGQTRSAAWDLGRSMNPRSIAVVTAEVRSATPSFSKACWRCVLTVASLIRRS